MGILSRFSADPKTKFAKQVLAEVNRHGVEEAWIKEPDFAIGYRRASGDEPGWIYLNNVYLESQGLDRAGVRQKIEGLVRAVLDTSQLPKTWAEVRVCLRPVIRAETFGLAASEHPMLCRPLLPFLNEMVVVDTPVAMAYVQLRQLGEWGVSAEEVYAAAHQNLAAIATIESSPEQRQQPRLIRFADDGNGYFVSRLLVPGWLASFATPFGRPVAFMPSGNHLLISTGAEDSLPALLEMVEKDFNEEPRSISPQAYTIDITGQLIQYPLDSPHEKHIHRAATLLAAAEYGSQKRWLEQEHEKTGTDIFVASHTVMQRPDESLFSVAIWGAEVDSLLPRTDYVAMATDHDRFFVAWDTLTALVPMEPAEGYAPQRFRVTSWPERAIVEALKRVSVSP
jgi:hypothetical protein